MSLSEFWTKDRIKDMFTQILQGVSLMHNLEMAHGDLKLVNVVVIFSKTPENYDSIKLIDFGQARY